MPRGAHEKQNNARFAHTCRSLGEHDGDPVGFLRHVVAVIGTTESDACAQTYELVHSRHKLSFGLQATTLINDAGGR
jgi:hypothetical protein